MGFCQQVVDCSVAPTKTSRKLLTCFAGFQSVSDVTQFSVETWQRMLTVHLTAPFLLIQRFLPDMVDRGNQRCGPAVRTTGKTYSL